MSSTQSSEEVLDGQLIVHVYDGYRGGRKYHGPLISIGSVGNRSGSMTLTPVELAALLDGPLERALTTANKDRS